MLILDQRQNLMDLNTLTDLKIAKLNAIYRGTNRAGNASFSVSTPSQKRQCPLHCKKLMYIYRMYCCETTGNFAVRDTTVDLTVNLHRWYCKY